MVRGQLDIQVGCHTYGLIIREQGWRDKSADWGNILNARGQLIKHDAGEGIGHESERACWSCADRVGNSIVDLNFKGASWHCLVEGHCQLSRRINLAWSHYRGGDVLEKIISVKWLPLCKILWVMTGRWDPSPGAKWLLPFPTRESDWSTEYKLSWLFEWLALHLGLSPHPPVEALHLIKTQGKSILPLTKLWINSKLSKSVWKLFLKASLLCKGWRDFFYISSILILWIYQCCPY